MFPGKVAWRPWQPYKAKSRAAQLTSMTEQCNWCGQRVARLGDAVTGGWRWRRGTAWSGVAGYAASAMFHRICGACWDAGRAESLPGAAREATA